MSDELSTPRVTGVTDALAERREPGQGGPRPQRRNDGGDEERPAGFQDYDDRASVHGIPEAELTPAVQAALADLMAEIDRLHDETRHQHERIERLEDEVEAHPFLPVKNRRGLFHAIRRILPRIAEGQMSAALLCLHVGGIERLRLHHGLPAAEAALRHVAERLGEDVRQSDVLANVGLHDFAILMPLADAAAAAAKAERLAESLAASPFRWAGGAHALSLSWRVVEIDPREAPDETLLKAAPMPATVEREE